MTPQSTNPTTLLTLFNNDYFCSIFQNKLGETSKEFIIQESYEPNCVVGLCGDFSSGSAGFKSELFSSILITLSIILMTVKWMNFFKALFYFIYKVDLTKFNKKFSYGILSSYYVDQILPAIYKKTGTIFIIVHWIH